MNKNKIKEAKYCNKSIFDNALKRAIFQNNEKPNTKKDKRKNLQKK